MPRRLTTLLPLLLAACGGLDTPDLAHGEVAGRITGATPGVFAYPLGAPDRKVALDADGGFALADLPAGPARLVLFDGGLNAELVDLQVEGADRTWVERSAAAMPPAGRLVLSVVPDGAVVPVAARYQVQGTDQAGVASRAGGAVLFPLPAGSFDLDTQLDGFQATRGTIQVRSGATDGVEVRLQVATAGPLGCAALGDQCRNDLRCDAADGHCYQCRIGRDDCGPGATCDPATRFCGAVPGGAASAVCSACGQDADCGAAGSGAYCEKATGAATGYCSRRAGCPAGFEADPAAAGGPACRALLGCHEYFEEFGEQCFSDATCDASHGLVSGRCRGADPLHGVPGSCTAPCPGGDADCIVSGFTCDPVEQVCVRPPVP